MRQYLIKFTYLMNGNHFAEQDTVFAETPKQAVEKIKQRYSVQNIDIESVHESVGFQWGYVSPFWWEE